MTSYFYLNFDLLKKSGLLLLTFMTVALLVLPLTVKAQVNIGSADPPQPFSILEFSTKLKEGGLRMPQLSTKERDKLDVTSDTAQGLWIYNTDNNCLEFWNGKKWISLCSGVLVAPIGVTLSPAMSNVAVGDTVNLRATVNPANATSIQYEWERSSNGINWTIVAGESASTLNVTPNFTGDFYFRVTASNNAGEATSNVAQITVSLPEGGGTYPTIQMYAGAFWRSREKGERLIQFGVGTGLNNSGNWTASVAWYDDKWNPDTDGVVLANSAPAALPKSGDAESFPVTGGARSISGTVAEGGTLSFRIGLDKQFADSNAYPARYAVVMLNYNNGKKWYKMFIRQGESADYVMRPGDPGTGVPAGRPAAVKFSPYNITDPSGNMPTNFGKADILSAGGGHFTNFPTKAGYDFQYSSTAAIAPDNPTGSLSAWTTNGAQTATVSWSPSWDVCPSGYHRPTDGANNTTTMGTGVIAGSEIRQSLWLNPPVDTLSNTDNSTWGYYADGYFDRLALQSSVGQNTITNSAVNPSTVDVAYIGRLFFNPTTNASLFFPAAGYRFCNSGQLYNAGGRARYWTSSAAVYAARGCYDWYFSIRANLGETPNASLYDKDDTPAVVLPLSNETTGASVRCVKNP